MCFCVCLSRLCDSFSFRLLLIVVCVVGTVRRKSEFDENPLKWELDGEVGVWDMCIVMGNLEKPQKVRKRRLCKRTSKIIVFFFFFCFF